ncbi:hypothetical protein [Oceanobacillus kimchii]|uniref:Replication protein n=1 Tax=Oceanobacillus kimchii TaxID=746691 RepID=A0ABQ5TJ87_9BACI|nr:hypothetical protein [Oceanobacillus kimchii]GLO66157.1 hypothetical protein MACH08_19410 [Oceanobacillus kimchii]
MDFDKFGLSRIKIKSNWFEQGKDSIFYRMGKEEGLNIYLQLFRFRVHQGSFYEHYFVTSINELRKFTKVNGSSRLSSKHVVSLLKNLTSLGIIQNHTIKNWKYIFDDKGQVMGDRLLKLEATDTPNTHAVSDDYGNTVDKPITNEDWYISINFKIINHMYKDLSLNAKDIVVYLLLLKLSNSGENKATININTMKKWLGYGNDTILEILKRLNAAYMVATYVRVKGKSISFEHLPVKSYDQIGNFKKTHKEQCVRFLKRYS